MPGLVHVVDDDASFRTAIERRLKLAGYDVATYASSQDLLDRLPREELQSCILLDVQMPGLTGPDLQTRLHELGSTVPIVFLTGHADTATTVRTIKAGAEDFLTKPVARERLLEAIQRALMHGEQAREQDSRAAALRSLMSQLTAREHDVFALLARGKPHKQIAYALGISERTVKFHRRNVLQKFGARSLADLAVAADRLGLLSEPAA